MNVFLAKRRADSKQTESGGIRVFSVAQMYEVPQLPTFYIPETVLRVCAWTPVLLETPRSTQGSSDSAWCCLQACFHYCSLQEFKILILHSALLFLLKLHPSSAAPCCGSDEYSQVSPVANHSRHQVNKVVHVVIKPSHFQTESAVATTNYACVGNESICRYTSSEIQLLLCSVPL